MKKYDILDIAIKILGLSMITPLISDLIAYIFMFIQFSNSEELKYTISGVFGYLIYTIAVYFFIFRTRDIIKILKQKTDIDIEIKSNFETSGLFFIAFIAIGGISLLKTIPTLVYNIFAYNQTRKLQDEYNKPFVISAQWALINSITIFFAIILIIYAKPLGEYFAKRLNKNNIFKQDEK